MFSPIFSDEDSSDASESILFHSWVVIKISDFLEVLETDLARGCASHLEAILAQSMYFGLSFSRVGADFRPQLRVLTYIFTTLPNNFCTKFDSF